MADRPKFFDDLAGVAGGAFSALNGLQQELESAVRARIDDAIRKLDLVRREELDAVAEMAANARAGEEAALAELAVLTRRVAALEAASHPAPAGFGSAGTDGTGSAGASEADPGTLPHLPEPPATP